MEEKNEEEKKTITRKGTRKEKRGGMREKRGGQRKEEIRRKKREQNANIHKVRE